MRKHFKKYNFVLAAVLFGVLIFGWSVDAQVGPGSQPGVGSGAISADSSGNVGIGGAAAAGVRLRAIASTSDTTTSAFQLLKQNGGIILNARGDGYVGIGTSTPAYPLTVWGNIQAANGGSFIGSMAASNITSGVFGAGNFAFPASLGVATSSQVGLPQALSVYGNGYMSGALGLGTSNIGSAKLTVLQNSTYNNESTAGIRIVDTTATDVGLLLGADAAGDYAYIQSLDPGTSYATRPLLINPNGGSVGIGTVSPGAVKLNVIGDAGSTAGAIQVTRADLGGSASHILYGATGDWYIRSSSASGMVSLQDTGGNVGIGDSTPSYKLDVTGQINSTGGLCIAGDCKTAWSQVGGTTTTAANVAAGTFGANTGGGAYSFASSVNHTGNIYAQQVGVSPIGVYDPAKTQQVWAMGPCYRLPDAGATTAGTYGTSCANFYGIGWSYEPDYGAAGNNPQSIAGLSHQALFMINGTTYSAVGNGMWTRGGITGTQFTDFNNSSYYLNPDGQSILAGSVRIGATTAPSNALHVTGNMGATGWVGAGCEGACESSGGYGLMYGSGQITLQNSSGNQVVLTPSATTYGSLVIGGSNNGYSGITFSGVTGNGNQLMVNNSSDIQGFYKEGVAWSWYFQGGALTAGTVPAARVTPGAFQAGDYSVSGSFTGTEMYSNGWFRNNNASQGMYNSNLANHFYAESTSNWTITPGTDAPAGGLVLRASYGGTVRGQLYSDGSNFGLLNNAGNWAVQIPNGATNVNLLGTVTVGGGTGKINVGTVDPLYTIEGKKYATFLPAMTGQKEETTGSTELSKDENGIWTKVIDFKDQEEASDLWLFAKITNIEKQFDKMVVLLTPGFEGRVWYERDAENLKLVIHGEHGGEVSYRLTAPRFDGERWTNRSDEKEEGFNLDKLLKQ